MKVWVSYRDDGYEGKSEPLAVFTSRQEADAYMLATEHAMGMVNLKVKEFDVADPRGELLQYNEDGTFSRVDA